MVAMKRALLALAFVLMLVPAAVHAQEVSILIGAQTVSFGGDVGKYWDVPPGPGPALLVGIDLGVPIDIRFGRRMATEGKSGGDLTYQWIEAGPRFSLGLENSDIQPDWFFGVGSYDLEIDGEKFDTAIGGYAGLGIQEVISQKYLGRIEVKTALWQSGTGKTDGATLNLSLLFGTWF